MAAGGDASIRCSNGTLPLDIARQNGHNECVRLLIAAEATLNAACGDITTQCTSPKPSLKFNPKS
jgi:hypothetical protein